MGWERSIFYNIVECWNLGVFHFFDFQSWLKLHKLAGFQVIRKCDWKFPGQRTYFIYSSWKYKSEVLAWFNLNKSWVEGIKMEIYKERRVCELHPHHGENRPMLSKFA